jgi:hypothetical protein
MAQLSRPHIDISNSGWTAVPAPGAEENNPLSYRLNDFPNTDSTYVLSSSSSQGDSVEVELVGLAGPQRPAPDDHHPAPTGPERPRLLFWTPSLTS